MAEQNIMECNICGAKVKTKKYYDKHMKAHMNPKSFCCQFCGKRYNYDAGLNNHLHRVHKEEYLNFLGVQRNDNLMEAYKKNNPNMTFNNYISTVTRLLDSSNN